MPEFTKHAPGTFCWLELGTTDQAAAKAFYGSLFGWTPEDVPMGPDMVYTLLKVEGLDVGALYALMPDQLAQGIPPNWLPYVSVASADESAARARALGGSLVMEPFDVMALGRMAIVKDPQGAVIAMWQAGTHHGFRFAGDVNTYCWAELRTTDPAAAERFYRDLFGWTSRAGSTPGMEYTELALSGQPIGGMMGLPPEWGPMPPHWGVYFAVADCDAAVEKTTALGGNVTVPPMDMPGVGRFAALRDPQGAMFAIFKPAMG